MHDLIETVSTAMSDAAREGKLDLGDPAARREAVAWTLAIVAHTDPALMAVAAADMASVMAPGVRNDPQAVGVALNEYVLPRATAYLN